MPALDGSSAVAADTVTVLELVTFGAVNNPVGEMVPAFALHVTDVFAVLANVAVNCNCVPDATTALLGVTDGATGFFAVAGAGVGLVGAADAETEEQFDVAKARASAAKTPTRRIVGRVVEPAVTRGLF